MSCGHCDDGEGGCLYPFAGVAPHTCGFKNGGPVVGSSVELPASEWPANYVHEGEPNPGGYPGIGTYTHCLQCGAPHAHQ